MISIVHDLDSMTALMHCVCIIPVTVLAIYFLCRKYSE